MPLGSTWLFTDMSTRNISCGGGGGRAKDGRCVDLTTLPSSCAVCLEIMGDSTTCNPRGLSRPVQELLYLYCT